MSRDTVDRAALDRAYETACEALLAERCAEGYWIGELSSSALATATAVSALSLVGQSEVSDLESQISNLKSPLAELIARGLRWLAEHQNSDGGWGDTTLSLSNISTTMLVRAAFHLAGAAEQHATILDRAVGYIDRAGGAAAVAARYGKDRTFAVPILANCALAGQADWRDVPPLPFELACLPHSWFRLLRLHVVSYALPALIAIGQLIHAKRPSWNLLTRWLRSAAVAPTLGKLEAIQPASGGFLEAIPLTSFVTMSLAATGRAGHPVARRGVEFLAATVRSDGSWPIDSNLSIWLTTLSINALAAAPDGLERLTTEEQCAVRDWLVGQQLCAAHPYTNAAPGGWGWSHLSGSVPDADDTAGALLALAALPESEAASSASCAGVRWLLDLRNRDGGWPTFCRGWGKLPFDRSGADLTAHALRAVEAWSSRWRYSSSDRAPEVQRLLEGEIPGAACAGLGYLAKQQRRDGSWFPLWFGNQHAPDDANATYGTSRVLAAYSDLSLTRLPAWRRGIHWLSDNQNADGGWGGAESTPSTVEETALALAALVYLEAATAAADCVRRGVAWLVNQVESGNWKKPSPIGLYFAKLWYFEKLYPLIFTVAALGRARRVLNPRLEPTSARV